MMIRIRVQATVNGAATSIPAIISTVVAAFFVLAVMVLWLLLLLLRE